jgi:hypothetical protein
MASRRATRPRWAIAALAAGLLGLVAVAGCSASDSSQPTTAGSPELADRDAGGANGYTPQEPGAAPQQDGDPVAAPMAPVEERSLVYTGTITVKVEDVVAAADRAIAQAVGLGGIVAGDNRHLDDDGSQITLVLRVPADRFNSTLDSLSELGTEEGREVKADDVTEALVDLNARIATQQASVDRVRALLAQANNIGEIVSIESELTRRQAELDSLLQRRATMSGLVDLATITVVLYGQSGPVVAAHEDETGFLAGLRDGWNGFLASVKIVLTVAGWLLPWVLAVGGPIVLALWLARRRRRAAVTPE